VHIWYHDRQGGIQSYGLNIVKSLPHFFILLLALQRLDLEGWGFAPSLGFDAFGHSPAQLEVTLHKLAGGSGALVQQPAAYVKVTHDQVLQEYWGLVGRATTVYECALAGRPPKEQVVKLSWPEVGRTPEHKVLKVLGGSWMRKSRGTSQNCWRIKFLRQWVLSSFASEWAPNPGAFPQDSSPEAPCNHSIQEASSCMGSHGRWFLRHSVGDPPL